MVYSLVILKLYKFWVSFIILKSTILIFMNRYFEENLSKKIVIINKIQLCGNHSVIYIQIGTQRKTNKMS